MIAVESHAKKRNNFDVGQNLRRYGSKSANNFAANSKEISIEENCGIPRQKKYQFDSIHINAPTGRRALYIESGDALIDGTLCVKKLNILDGAEVAAGTVVTLNLNGKRIRYAVPTRIAEFSMPYQPNAIRCSASVLSRDNSPLYWRLFDKNLQSTIAQGEQGETVEFEFVYLEDHKNDIEVHVWKSSVNDATPESLRIDYI